MDVQAVTDKGFRIIFGLLNPSHMYESIKNCHLIIKHKDLTIKIQTEIILKLLQDPSAKLKAGLRKVYVNGGEGKILKISVQDIERARKKCTINVKKITKIIH